MSPMKQSRKSGKLARIHSTPQWTVLLDRIVDEMLDGGHAPSSSVLSCPHCRGTLFVVPGESGPSVEGSRREGLQELTATLQSLLRQKESQETSDGR